METLDTLRKERDEARDACVGLIIADTVDAYDTRDLLRVLHCVTKLNACPYKDQIDRAMVGLSVGNFVAGCFAVGSIASRKKEEGEVLFEATA